MDETKISAMRAGGQIIGEIMRDLKAYVEPGMTKREVDAWVREQITSRGAGVAYDLLTDPPFPGSICISVGDELVHGAPNSDYAFESSDKVSFDLVILYQGYYVDCAFTMIVGGTKAASPAVRQLLKTTSAALQAGIKEVKPGATVGDIGYAVEKALKKGHLGVVTNYIGHGIGKTMHEAPEVPNYGKRGAGYRLKPGDCICIEPMSSLGKPANYIDRSDPSNWTVRLKDGSIACHCEHTILVTESGHEVLTSLNPA